MTQTPLIRDAFGRVVHRLREERGIPLEDFGRLKPWVLSEVEHGTHTVYLQTVFSIAHRLNITPSELVRLTELEQGSPK